MSQIEVERLLGRLLTDPDFRTKAAHSFEKTASKEGIVLSQTETAILRNIDFSQFNRVSDALDDSIKRS